MIKINSEGKYFVDLSQIKSEAIGIVPVANMDDWITTDPATWSQIEIYINKLKAEAEQCINPSH